MTINPKDAPNAEAEEDEDDLFGSDSEEEDPEAVKKREENLAAYKKKKEGKAKPAAKSIVTLDVKPWGKHSSTSCHNPQPESCAIVLPSTTTIPSRAKYHCLRSYEAY